MIGIVYGYCVRHGGIGRYISEALKHAENPSKYGLLTLEKTIDCPPSVDVNLIQCSRNQKFMSIEENEAFSAAVGNIASLSNKYNLLHSHGVYNLVPDLYTAHICLDAYLNKFVEIFGNFKLSEHLRDLSSLTEVEEYMISNLSEENIVAVSRKVAKDLSVRYDLDENKIKIIHGASRFKPNKIDSAEGADGINSKKLDKPYKVGFVGSNLYSKGIIFIKDILKELSDRGFSLKCMGAGCDSLDIIDLLNQSDSYKTNLLGKCDLSKGFYTNLDCFLSLGVYDGYSLSTLEAMSLGVPVVSSDLNGVFFDSKVGKGSLRLATVDDITDTEHVSDLIEQIFTDEKFRGEVVRSGFEIAKESDWSDVASRYEDVYNSIL